MVKNLFKEKETSVMNEAPLKKDILYIADGNFFLHRAKHAMKDVTFTRSSDGLNTTYIKGFLNILCADLSIFQPSHAVVVFDGRGKNFRHRLYPEYKANRKVDDASVKDNTSAIMWESMNYIRDVCKHMGILCLQLPNTEGDDVISTLAYLPEEGMRTIISSADKDMHCLLDKFIWQYNGINRVVMKPKDVCDKFGIRHVSQMTDYLALCGDKVDGIPGIPGLGSTTASTILSHCKNVEEFLSMSFTDNKRTTWQRKIKEGNFALWKKLVTLQVIDLLNAENEPLTIDDLETAEPDKEAIQEWLSNMEFRSYPKYIQMLLGLGDTNRARRLL